MTISSNSVSSTSPSPSPPDALTLQKTLLEMRHQLASQNAIALQESLNQLGTAAQPAVLLQILASHLFRDDSATTTAETKEDVKASSDELTDDPLSSSEALSLVGLLVAHNAARYLGPAARAVRDEAKRLQGSSDPMHVSPELLQVLLAQLSGNEVQVSTDATEAVVACCRKLGTAVGEPALRGLAEAWRQAWNATDAPRAQTSTVAVRCASAMVDLACLDGTMMTLAQTCGDIRLLLTMLTDESDPLLEISTLDLIERMAVTHPMHPERAHWLFSRDVVVPLLQMCGGTDQGVADPLLGGPALRVVAALCRLAHRDAALTEFSNTEITHGFHRALHNYNGGSGEMDRLAIIDAVSSFASASSDALDLVASDPVTRQAWLSLSVAQPKLKSVVLHSVAMVLNPMDGTDSNGDTVANPPPSNALGMKLFSQLGHVNNDEATKLILSLAKSPLPETRLAAYALLIAVAKMETGGQVLLTHPDFLEFLLNRDSEKIKEGREAKYSLVEVILKSPVRGLLAEDIVRQLEKYIQHGIHYLPTQTWELATE